MSKAHQFKNYANMSVTSRSRINMQHGSFGLSDI